MRILTAAVILSILTCSGCLFKEFVPVKSSWVNVYAPEKPNVAIPENPDVTNPDVAALLKAAYVYERYSNTLLTVIAEYNAEAKKHNDKILEDLK